MGQVLHTNTKLSVCIPAFNRPREIIQTLESIVVQGTGKWDVIICEDKSPRGDEIRAAVKIFSENHLVLPIHYYANDENLGYDHNLRMLLDKADGEYCVFLGDDDLLAPGALERIVQAVSRPNVGFVLRAWKSIDKDTEKDVEEHRYFSKDRFFPLGIESIAAMYRRSVFISGLTVHRETARRFHTDRFDGLLLYQLYLVGKIISCMNGYYISEILAIRQVGGEHFFGSSDSEKGRFVPKQLLPLHSINFLKGLFDIARILDSEVSPGVLDLIMADLGRYSYPMLEIQAQKLNKAEFRKYAHLLSGLGLRNSKMFWFYFRLLLLLGPRASNFVIRKTKLLLGHTPNLGRNNGVAV